MTFEEPKGLSQAHLNALVSFCSRPRLQASSLILSFPCSQRTSLQQSASSLLGAEMIYELCTNAAQFITDRHQDMERGKQTSLEDQRRKRGQEEERVGFVSAFPPGINMANKLLYRRHKKPTLEQKRSSPDWKRPKLHDFRNSSRKTFGGRRSFERSASNKSEKGRRKGGSSSSRSTRMVTGNCP